MNELKWQTDEYLKENERNKDKKKEKEERKNGRKIRTR